MSEGRRSRSLARIALTGPQMRADVDHPQGSSIEPLLSLGSGEPDDAGGRAEALTGCGGASRIRWHSAAVTGRIAADILADALDAQPGKIRRGRGSVEAEDSSRRRFRARYIGIALLLPKIAESHDEAGCSCREV